MQSYMYNPELITGRNCIFLRRWLKTMLFILLFCGSFAVLGINSATLEKTRKKTRNPLQDPLSNHIHTVQLNNEIDRGYNRTMQKRLNVGITSGYLETQRYAFPKVGPLCILWYMALIVYFLSSAATGRKTVFG